MTALKHSAIVPGPGMFISVQMCALVWSKTNLSQRKREFREPLRSPTGPGDLLQVVMRIGSRSAFYTGSKGPFDVGASMTSDER
jgi:hypothetical protein